VSYQTFTNEYCQLRSYWTGKDRGNAVTLKPINCVHQTERAGHTGAARPAYVRRGKARTRTGQRARSARHTRTSRGTALTRGHDRTAHPPLGQALMRNGQSTTCMLYNCLEWYKWVLTNLYHDRQLYNTLIPPLHELPVVGLRISGLSGFVELTIRYTTPDIHCRHRRHECDGGIMTDIHPPANLR